MHLALYVGRNFTVLQILNNCPLLAFKPVVNTSHLKTKEKT
jgi:hypothetical protein